MTKSKVWYLHQNLVQTGTAGYMISASNESCDLHRYFLPRIAQVYSLLRNVVFMEGGSILKEIHAQLITAAGLCFETFKLILRHCAYISERHKVRGLLDTYEHLWNAAHILPRILDMGTT
jgi:hypothetical protein